MSQPLIQVSHLYKSFGPQVVFEDISLSLGSGEIFALIGENGAGKTTLLRHLAGEEQPDAGEVWKAPQARVGFLPQEIKAPNITTRAFLEESKFSSLEERMAECLNDSARIDEWAQLHELYERLGGYQRIPLEKVLYGLKLDSWILDKSMEVLSSGQKSRAALAKALLENPEVLLLDEPTNHLDKQMLCWLKEMLSARKGATVIVSHDRKFLNETCNQLIDLTYGKLTRYGGNYDFYLEELQCIEERKMRAYQSQQEEQGVLRQQIKACTFSQKKPSPPKDRNKMSYTYHGELHQKSVQHTLGVLKKQLVAIEENLLPHPKPKAITGLKFAATPLSSSVALELRNVTKRFGERLVFEDLSTLIYKNDRIIVTGPNGTGKTTLLRCIAGVLSLDAGEIRYAPSAKIAYLDQEVVSLPMDKTPLQYFESKFLLTEEGLRRELAKAALSGEGIICRPFYTLSVGQRKRLMLLSLILEKPNILLLDEPTNHLDFLTLEALEAALVAFDGVIIAASHDATFIEKLGRLCGDELRQIELSSLA